MALWRPLPGLVALRAPLNPRYDLDGGPRRAADAAIAAILATPDLPRIIVAYALPAEGPHWDVLQADGRITIMPTASWERALLDRATAPTAEAYLGSALSSSTRKSLRRKRRALEELGPLRLTASTNAGEAAAGFNTFKRLEAAGWKGRDGTALEQDAEGEAHVRGRLLAGAADGTAFTVVMSAGERPVAAGLFLRDGGEVGFWKTTYDETLAKHSPGVVFDVMLTEWLYSQLWFARLDAGHDDSVNPATLIWAQRRRMANVVIDLSPGSVKGRVVVALLKARQRLRAWRNGRLAQAAK
jgi:CelD/BcsL family acetyltransferase involved in cellulose biosynthesis